MSIVYLGILHLHCIDAAIILRYCGSVKRKMAHPLWDAPFVLFVQRYLAADLWADAAVGFLATGLAAAAVSVRAWSMAR